MPQEPGLGHYIMEWVKQYKYKSKTQELYIKKYS